MQHELIHNNEVCGFDNSGFAERTLPARYGSGVAQISNLLYRRIPFGRTSDDSVTQEISTAGGLEIRDTAGWKPALLRNLSKSEMRPEQSCRWRRVRLGSPGAA